MGGGADAAGTDLQRLGGRSSHGVAVRCEGCLISVVCAGALLGGVGAAVEDEDDDEEEVEEVESRRGAGKCV